LAAAAAAWVVSAAQPQCNPPDQIPILNRQKDQRSDQRQSLLLALLLPLPAAALLLLLLLPALLLLVQGLPQ
jgi:hypothetical protein